MNILFYLYIKKIVFLSFCFLRKENIGIGQRISQLVYGYLLELGLHFKNTKKHFFLIYKIINLYIRRIPNIK